MPYAGGNSPLQRRQLTDGPGPSPTKNSLPRVAQSEPPVPRHAPMGKPSPLVSKDDIATTLNRPSRRSGTPGAPSPQALSPKPRRFGGGNSPSPPGQRREQPHRQLNNHSPNSRSNSHSRDSASSVSSEYDEVQSRHPTFGKVTVHLDEEGIDEYTIVDDDEDRFSQALSLASRPEFLEDIARRQDSYRQQQLTDAVYQAVGGPNEIEEKSDSKSVASSNTSGRSSKVEVFNTMNTMFNIRDKFDDGDFAGVEETFSGDHEQLITTAMAATMMADRLMSLSDYPIVMMGTDCMVLSASKDIETLFGYSKDELIGQNINILMPHSLAMRHDSIIQNYLDQRRVGKRQISSVVSNTRPVVAISKAGREVQVFLSVRAIEGEGQNSVPVMFIGQFRIAETEVGLRAALTEAQLLEKVFPFPYLEADEQGTILRFNPAAELAFGLAAGVAIGKNVVILMPEYIFVDGKKKERRMTHHRLLENYMQKVRDVGVESVPSRIVENKTRHRAVRVSKSDMNSVREETFDVELEVTLSMNAQGMVRLRSFFRVQETFMNKDEVLDTVIDHVFPAPVATRIKAGQVVSAGTQEVTVIFADIVGFTSLLSNMSDDQTITVLNDIWKRFADIQKVFPSFYPVKTNYDEMMVVVGLYDEQFNHAQEGVSGAFLMLQAVQEHNEAFSNSIEVRIGISTGPVILTVSDGFRMSFDVIGESTVLAARAETTGRPNHIHMTESTYLRLDTKTKMRFIRREEPVHFKNVGSLVTYLSSNKRRQHVKLQD
jgi:PAS domain S-box-containing protein